jgi:hypothetical protein
MNRRRRFSPQTQSHWGGVGEGDCRRALAFDLSTWKQLWHDGLGVMKKQLWMPLDKVLPSTYAPAHNALGTAYCLDPSAFALFRSAAA